MMLREVRVHSEYLESAELKLSLGSGKHKTILKRPVHSMMCTSPSRPALDSKQPRKLERLSGMPLISIPEDTRLPG